MDGRMKALVVVDYQNDFVTGSLGFDKAKRLEHVILDKIRDCRAAGGRIIFTRDTHGENYLESAEGKKLPIVHCVKGTEGYEIYGEVKNSVLKDDIIIDKPAFGSLDLAETLREYKFNEVELCGLVTDICVISNAVIAKAALPESKVIVDAEACACADEKAHIRALEVMKGLQIDVLNL